MQNERLWRHDRPQHQLLDRHLDNFENDLSAMASSQNGFSMKYLVSGFRDSISTECQSRWTSVEGVVEKTAAIPNITDAPSCADVDLNFYICR
jgi:hypothetical protein